MSDSAGHGAPCNGRRRLRARATARRGGTSRAYHRLAKPARRGTARSTQPALVVDRQPKSRDLDQIEYAEQLANGDIRVLVGIADVDALVPAGSPIDAHAQVNATSVYTGVVTFPMLPDQLSSDLTSLIANADRPAIVVEFVVAQDGSLRSSNVQRALVRNHAKLDYESVGAWLEGHALPDSVHALPGLEAQLRLQDEATERLRELRLRNGALDLETIEARVVMDDDRVSDLRVLHKNRARYLIESLMIAANGVLARLLEDSGRASIQRIVRTPSAGRALLN